MLFLMASRFFILVGLANPPLENALASGTKGRIADPHHFNADPDPILNHVIFTTGFRKLMTKCSYYPETDKL
jgi:hypothetical protein